MQEIQNQIKSDTKEPLWQSSQYSNLIRYGPSGTYYARFRVRGKLVWKSLKTKTISVAKMKLGDMEKQERSKAEKGRLNSKAKILVEDAIQAYKERGFRPADARNKKDAKALKPAAFAYYEQRVKALIVGSEPPRGSEKQRVPASWPGLDKKEIRKVTEGDCQRWADKARVEMSPSVFNHTIGVLRNIFDFGIKAGLLYNNPAKAIMRESESPKNLELPDASKFEEFVREIENGGNGYSKHCANLVRFMAFGGLRKGEAANVTWQDCDFTKGQITLRGDPETGLKGRKAGDIRIIPMISEMRQLLEGLRKNRPLEKPSSPVMEVKECEKSMTRAATAIGMTRITHHDLRHLFATRCIESGVDIPTVARWLGHKDGGALAMRVYGHLRDQHSTDMAQRVSFTKTISENIIPMKQEAV